MKKILVLAGLIAAGTVTHAQTISVQKIIVNPVVTQLQVNASMNKAGNNPVYYPNENITLSTSITKDAYVYVFSVDANNQVDMIFPNKYDNNNYLKANTAKNLPSNAQYKLTVTEPYGVNKVLFLASEAPLNTSDIAYYTSNPQELFARVTVNGQDGLAQRLAIVVQPIDQSKWVANTLYYTVARNNTVTPPPVVPPVQPSNPSSVQLPYYPNAVVNSNNRSEEVMVLNFTSYDAPQSIFNYYKTQLERQGYRIMGSPFNRKNEIRADFQRNNSAGDDSVELRLRYNQGNKRYTLALSF